MKWYVYVGGFSNSIEIFQLNVDDDDVKKTTMTFKESVTVEEKPAFINMMEKTILYSVHELDSFQGEEKSCISTYKVEVNGSLTNIQTKHSAGVWPCHIAFNKPRNFIYIANYFSGHLDCAEIQKDGRLKESFVKHQFPKSVGSGSDQKRQMQSHPHGVYIKDEHVYITDLGADKIWHFQHGEGYTFLSGNPSSIETPKGTGPRHMVFHPTFDLAFVVGELKCDIIVYKFDRKNGNLEKVGVHNYLYPHQLDTQNYGAEIDVHRNGKFLYVSNRGHGSIISYRILDSNGTLEKIECFETLGTWPRAFGMEPNGKFILCAEQFKDSIEVLAIDEKSGKLDRICTVHCKNQPSSIVFKECT